MFKRPDRQPKYPEAASNRIVNKVLTYGLVAFIVYAVYSNSHQYHLKDKEVAETNYTPINWCKYFKVTNLINGKTTSYDFVENNQVRLELTSQDLNKIDDASFEGNKSLPVYVVEFDRNPNCQSIPLTAN